MLCLRLCFFQLGQVIWIGGHRENRIELLLCVGISPDRLIRFRKMQTKEGIAFAKLQSFFKFAYSFLRITADYLWRQMVFLGTRAN